MPLSIGDNLGPYEILAPIGATGNWYAASYRTGRRAR